MEEAQGGVVMALRAAGAAPATSPASASSSRAATEVPAPAPALGSVTRQRFSVELKAGETTIVSWKKLQKDGSREGVGVAGAAAPAGAHPRLESRIAPASVAAVDQPMDCEPKDGQAAPNRFNAVIEKIERLYMGKESSDEEELDGVPDDDQYDTEDSFIDDTELNDYFQVDKSTTKHHGFFVNRGKLEHTESSSSPNFAPKKRQRKDPANASSEKDVGRMPTEIVDVSNMKMKNAARHAALVGKKPSSPSNVPRHYGEHHQDGKHQKNKESMVTGTLKRKVEPSVTVNAELNSSLKMPTKEATLAMDVKEHKEQKIATAPSRDANKVKPGHASDTMQNVIREKAPSLKGENDQVSSTKIPAREKNGTIELPDLNIPGNVYPMQGDNVRVKEAPIRPKGTTLERAIHDLEKIVAEFRPPKQETQDADAAQGVKKRLPMEIKQKLAKVARLANSQGKIASEDFFNRLMGILGHLVQQKTLKRHLKEMVELGLSAKQAKADRFQQIKKEVIEMIKGRIAVSRSRMGEQQTGSSDDFQDSPSQRALKAKLSMDEPIEDKICDLYDLYIDGMDEDKGPQMRKLYGELSDLWPAGYIDSSGIKDAINRAKSRKRALYKQQKVQDEKLKRKRLSSTPRHEDALRSSHHPRTGHERLSNPALPLNGSSEHYAPKPQDKVANRSNSSISTDAASKAIVGTKKLKRSPDGIRTHNPKLPSHASGSDKEVSKQIGSSTESYPVKSGHNSSTPSGSEQPSR